MADRTLTVRFRAVVDGYERALASAAKATDAFASKADRLTDWSKRAGDIGGGLTARVTAPLTLIGGLATHIAADYEAAMREVQALTGATAAEMEMLSGRAKEMGADTQFSATEAADALSQLVKGGFTAREAYEALPGVMQLAAAAGLDIASAADIATNALSVFGLEVSDLAHVNDVLAQAANATDTDVTELGEALKYVGPIARSAGLSVEDTVGILGRFAENGVRGSAAGTELRRTISSLLKPTAEAQRVLSRLGVSTIDASGQLRPMVDIINDLHDAGASTTDIITIFGQQTSAMANVISQGKGPLEGLISVLEQSAGVAQNLADARMGGLSGSIEQLRGALENLAITAGEAGGSAFITALANAGAGLADAFSDLPGPLQTVTLSIVGLAAASGPAIWGISKLAGLYKPVVEGLQSMVGWFQGLRVQMALARMEGMSTGAALAASFGPQAAVLLGLAALAGALYFAKQRSDEFAASHINAATAAQEMAKAAGLASREVGNLGDEEGQARPPATQEEFIDANRQTFDTLKNLETRAEREAFLIQIGYELVLRGATPEEAFEQIRRLAEAAGIQLPVTLTIANIDDFQNQVKAAADQARAIASKVDNETTSQGDLTSTIKVDLDRIARSAADAYATGGVEQFTAVLAAAEAQLGDNAIAVNYLTDQALKYTDVTDLSTSKAKDTATALDELGASGAGAGAETRKMIPQIIDLAKAMDGGLTPANLAAAAAQLTAGDTASDYSGKAKDAADQASNLAGDMDDQGEAAGDAADKTQDLNAALARAQRAGKLAALGFDAAEAAADAYLNSIERASTVDDLLQVNLSAGSALKSLRKGLFGEGQDADTTADKNTRLKDALDAMGDAAEQADPKLTAMGIKLGALAAAADGFRRSIADSSGIDDQIDAALDLGAAFTDFRKVAKRLPKDIDMVALSMGRYKPRQRQAIEDLLQLGKASQDYLGTLIETGRTTAFVRGEADRLRAEYVAQLRQAGLNEDQIRRYIEVLGLTPEQVETAIKLSGQDKARFEIQSYLSLLEGRIPEEVASNVATLIQKGDLDAAARILADWAKTNPVKIPVEPDSKSGAANELKMELPHDFDLAAAALGKYTDAQQAALESVLDFGDQAHAAIAKLIESGDVEGAKALAGQFRDAFIGIATEAGLSREEAEKYLGVLGLMPEQVDTAITVSGTEEAMFKVQALMQLLEGEIDAEHVAEVAALIDQGKYDEAAALLADLAKDRTTTVTVNTVVGNTTVGAVTTGSGMAVTGGLPAANLPNGPTSGATSSSTGQSVDTSKAPSTVATVRRATSHLPIRDYTDNERKMNVPSWLINQTNAGNAKAIIDLITTRQARFHGFAHGGLVDQGPRGTDRVRAWLTRDEYVSDVATVKHYSPQFFDAMKNRQVPTLDELHAAASNGMARAAAAASETVTKLVAAGDVNGAQRLAVDLHTAFTQVAEQLGVNPAVAARLAPTLHSPTDAVAAPVVLDPMRLPGRRNGGPVEAGESYRVLESGRAEIFQPTVPGTITPLPLPGVPTAPTIPGTVVPATAAMTPATATRIDGASISKLAAELGSKIPAGGDSYEINWQSTGDDRRSAEDLVRTIGTSKFQRTGRL